MKKIVLAAAMTSAVIAVPAAAAPGDTANTSGVANAEIVAPIAIVHDTNAALDFGIMTAGGGGTVVVLTDGSATPTVDVVLVSGSAPSADSFTVTGDPDRSFDIVTTSGTVTSAGGATMNFSTNADPTGTLDATGKTSFRVGGTLTVGANQAAGSYTGSYNATVTYN